MRRLLQARASPDAEARACRGGAQGAAIHLCVGDSCKKLELPALPDAAHADGDNGYHIEVNEAGTLAVASGDTCCNRSSCST